MGKRVRNLIGTLLLVMALAVTQIPVSDVEAVETSSASDFQMDGNTLVKYNGTAADVSISNYVEKIEAEAFAGNDNIKRVVLGDSVEVIGSRAFADCKNLESVSVSNSVTKIENAAFSGCPLLKEVAVGTGLVELGNGVFAGDYSLSTVRFDSSNPKFTCDDGAIYNKNGRDTLYEVLAGRKADSYSMPSTVSKITPYAFWGDYNLEKVNISSNVKEIPAYAFSNCKNLKDVGVPYSVKTIGLKAFEDCVRLREIEIPPSVSSIHSTAFDGCTKLEIKADAGSVADNFASTLELEDIEIAEYEEAPVPSGVSDNDLTQEDEQILPPVDYYHEVSHMNAMAEEEDVSVKGKTRVIGQEAFVLIDNAEATINVGSTGETMGGSPEVEAQYTDMVPGMEGSEDAKGGSFPKYTVVNNSIIAAQAYYDDEMTSFEIPDGIVRLGEFSFARSGLQSIRIPDGVEEIGYAAFYHCDGLTDVVIPSSVQEIEAAAFLNTPWLTQWKQSGSSDYLIVGDGILLAYKGNSSIVSIPAQVKQIGAEAFKGCSSVNKVILPDSVQVIGEGAFEGCSNLTEIEGGNNVVEIRDRAYADCPITTIHIPESVQHIGLRSYDRGNSLKSSYIGVVVFGGDDLPELSYETTATKLYRDNYRDLAFKGNTVAVIPEGVTDLTDTVLDGGKAGFEGIICKISKEAADGENGTLQIVGRQGSVSAPAAGETCLIDGLTYVFEEGAEKIANQDAQQDAQYQGIMLRVNSYTLPQDGLMNAVMEGSEENYILSIEDSQDAKSDIEAAYKKIYGNKLPQNLCGYDIDMTEADTGIPITELGKQSMEVTIPFPKGVGEENLHVVCLDADGQLEEVESRVVSMDGMDAITFQAKHFSSYGIYNYGTNNTVVADVKDGKAVFASLGNKDDSPDTGDYSIHPKWFLCAGLVCTAMAMFCYRGGRRRRSRYL